MNDYWTENGIEKPQQIVVCAACRHKEIPELILIGARHFDNLMHYQLKSALIRYGKFNKTWEQGFIDQFGDFLSREEAMEIVKKNGQPFNAERNGGDIYLYSEGLY